MGKYYLTVSVAFILTFVLSVLTTGILGSKRDTLMFYLPEWMSRGDTLNGNLSLYIAWAGIDICLMYILNIFFLFVLSKMHAREGKKKSKSF